MASSSHFNNWRRGQDLNLRCVSAHTLSKRAHSTTLTPLHIFNYFSIFYNHICGRMCWSPQTNLLKIVWGKGRSERFMPDAFSIGFLSETSDADHSDTSPYL